MAPSAYTLNRLTTHPSASATQNACKLCTPLGAALVFKGIAGAVPLLHGSQGCSTYIRRYLISHFREPVDIACSNFGEQTAIFGGGVNLQTALDNIRRQYDPALIGIATTCLAETIGDDVPMFLRQYRAAHADESLPPLVNVSTPSYQGTHMQGFHGAVKAVMETLAEPSSSQAQGPPMLNLFPGLVSPADLRHLRRIVLDFGLQPMMLPDYSQTLDGGLWESYQRIPTGGTPVADVITAGSAAASIELGRVLAQTTDTAATVLQTRCGVPAYRLGLSLGIRQTDRLLQVLSEISGRPVPEQHRLTRGRLLDALVDGHKYVNTARVAVYGEADLVAGLVDFLTEIGAQPVVCATGDAGSRLAKALHDTVDPKVHDRMCIMEDADFIDLEEALRQARPDLIIGHSKGYGIARKLGIPLVRVGFPVHDRLGGSRLLHVGYEGALALFDRIANTLIEQHQDDSEVGYTYM